MRIAMVVTPFDDHNLQLARQIGVTDIVIRYAGPEVGDTQPLCEQVQAHGMDVTVVEGYLPIDRVVLGLAGWQAQIDELSRLIVSMGACGIGVLCYNWMGRTDWTRTSIVTPGRGGASAQNSTGQKSKPWGHWRVPTSALRRCGRISGASLITSYPSLSKRE
jgi:mannonate dehydratase